jgi:hypothetical protein
VLQMVAAALPSRLMLIVTADSPFEISMLGAACDVVGYVDAGRGGGGEVILSCVHIAHAHGSATLPTALGTPPLPVSCWDGGWDDVDEVAMYELSNAAVAALTGGGDVHHSLALMLLVSLCSVTVDPVSHSALTVQSVSQSSNR